MPQANAPAVPGARTGCAHVLIVDDDAQTRDVLATLVSEGGFTVALAHDLDEVPGQFVAHTPDFILVNVFISDGDGMEIYRQARASGTEVIVISASETAAGGGADAGADRRTDTGQDPAADRAADTAADIIVDGDSDATPNVTASAASDPASAIGSNTERSSTRQTDWQRLEQALRRLADAAPMGVAKKPARLGKLYGQSKPMLHVYEQIMRVAPTDASVLIVGASGTGKELVAHALHEFSTRRKKPLVTVNCGAISANLIESEMFGHERGSFTGADRQHKGHFERAHGGTLFLDEITEMPLELQVRFLRVLETDRLIRVGGDREIVCDVRVVAATNRSPAAAMRDGKLREDLFYRLAVFPIHLPPLRERGDDIEMIANQFLQRLNADAGTARVFSPAALEYIRVHDWPGNVRELRNFVQRAFIMADGDALEPQPF